MHDAGGPFAGRPARTEREDIQAAFDQRDIVTACAAAEHASLTGNAVFDVTTASKRQVRDTALQWYGPNVPTPTLQACMHAAMAAVALHPTRGARPFRFFVELAMQDPETLDADFAFGLVRVDGPQDPDMVRRISAARRNEIRHCYHRALAEHPDAEGDLLVQFEIGADGMATHVTVLDSTWPVDSTGECVARTIENRWRFVKPPSGESTTVRLLSAVQPKATRSPPPRAEAQETDDASWEGSLVCSDASMGALVMGNVVCGQTLAECRAALEANHDAITAGLFESPPSYSACAAIDPEFADRVHCFWQDRQVVCSGIELVCQGLAAEEGVPTACTTYLLDG